MKLKEIDREGIIIVSGEISPDAEIEYVEDDSSSDVYYCEELSEQGVINRCIDDDGLASLYFVWANTTGKRDLVEFYLSIFINPIVIVNNSKFVLYKGL
jgi:hypothetical protein